jgi:hypothetical protein
MLIRDHRYALILSRGLNRGNDIFNFDWNEAVPNVSLARRFIENLF